MYFLSFETSTKIFSLALNRDEKVLRFRNLKTALVLEDSILPAMDKMLDAAGIKFNQIDGFAIALGPGSFTSLRVGLATVKSLAMATSKPVVGIPSMDIIAHGIYNMSFPNHDLHRRSSAIGNPFDYCDEICVLNDARREKVYACLYGPKGRKSDYLLATLEEVLAKVDGKTLFVGDGIGIYRKDIEAAGCKCLFADEKWWYPKAKVMAAMAYGRFQDKKYDDAANLLPLYLYAQDCQVAPPKAVSSPNVLGPQAGHSSLVVGDPKKNNK
jgi:tRNA threonylcarbamoyladenosine biosynthesis protein TsaB